MKRLRAWGASALYWLAVLLIVIIIVVGGVLLAVNLARWSTFPIIIA